MNVGGINVNWLKEKISFVIDGSYYVQADTNGGFLTPQPFAVSAPVNGDRTFICSAGLPVVSSLDINTQNYCLSGPRSYAASAVLAICDGLTAEETSIVLSALQDFISEYGIVSANT